MHKAPAHMLHHLSFGVSDLGRSSTFYDAVLSALGYVRVWTAPDAVGYAVRGDGDRFAIKLCSTGVLGPGPRFHVAFSAPSRDAVARFHAAALQHGGRDEGTPRVWAEYHEHYYAAFVADPDGYRIEAVFDDPV